VAAQNLTSTVCMKVLEDLQLVRLSFRPQSGGIGGHASFNELRLIPLLLDVKSTEQGGRRAGADDSNPIGKIQLAQEPASSRLRCYV